MKKWLLVGIGALFVSGAVFAHCGACGADADNARKKAACEMKGAQKKAACSMKKAACSMKKAACSTEKAACSTEKAACSTKKAACAADKSACQVKKQCGTAACPKAQQTEKKWWKFWGNK